MRLTIRESNGPNQLGLCTRQGNSFGRSPYHEKSWKKQDYTCDCGCKATVTVGGVERTQVAFQPRSLWRIPTAAARWSRPYSRTPYGESLLRP